MAKKKTVKKIGLKIVLPDKILLERDVEFVVIPGIDGDFGVGSGHAPFMSTIREGKIKIKDDDYSEEIDALKGFVEVLDDKVEVLPILKETVDEK